MSGRIEKENKLIQSINDKINGLPIIFKRFYQFMDGEHKSYGTIKHYIDYVADFMNYITDGRNDEDFYKTVTVADIRNYIASLRRRKNNGKEVKNGDSIQATRWSALNTFFNFLVLDDYIDYSPMLKTKRPKMQRKTEVVYLTPDEINTIMKKIETESPKKLVNRDKALFSLGISTGIRVGALTQVDIKDIDFETCMIHVVEKGDKERFIPFGDNMKQILALWLVDRNTYYSNVETDALFVSKVGRRITEEGVRLLMKKYSVNINKKITPHSMRKSCATNMAAAGVNIQTIANMLGHEQISTTQRYVDVLKDDKSEAVSVLDKLI